MELAPSLLGASRLRDVEYAPKEPRGGATISGRTCPLEIPMDFSVTCSCGNSISVSAANAGGDVRCACGKLITVPSLSDLREGIGHTKYDLGIVGRVRKAIADKELPSGRVCLKCGIETTSTLCFSVECERPWRSDGGFWKYFFVYLLAPIWIFAYVRREQDSAEVFGRETVVDVPLLICPVCQPTLRKSWRKSLIALLQKVPLYKQLLHEYPQSTVSIADKCR
jgi:hypothetical protein